MGPGRSRRAARVARFFLPDQTLSVAWRDRMGYFASIGCAWLILVAFAGCNSNKPAGAPSSAAGRFQPVGVRGIPGSSRPGGIAERGSPLAPEGLTAPQSADVLARTAQDYTKSLEPLLNSAARNPGTEPPAPANPRFPAPAETSPAAIASSKTGASSPEPSAANLKSSPAARGIETAPPAANSVGSISSPATPSPAPEPLGAPSGNALVRPASASAVSPAPSPSPGARSERVATGLTNSPAIIPSVDRAAPLQSSAGSAAARGAGENLEDKLARRVKDYPRDVCGQLDYQLLLLLKDEQVPNPAIAGLPAEDREVVSAVVDGLSNFRNTLRADNNTLLSRKIRPLVDLVERLKAQADLSIPTLALCTRVDGYGRYEPIDPPRFVAGKPHQAIVYCEVENFSSVQNAARRWETELTQQVVLYFEANDQTLMVWSDQPADIKDESRNRRRDFFVRKLVELPSTLTIGRYVLKVTIVDKQANRIAEASLPIQVVAGDALAGK